MVIARHGKSMRKLKVLFLFYRNFWIATLLITTFGSALVWQSDSIWYAAIFSMVKTITNLLIGLFVYILNADQLYFFNNLGFSTLDLHVKVMLIDMAIWFVFRYVALSL
jgi:hypothetical protein